MDRLEELKKEAIENPLKKKKGCSSCKKKKEIILETPAPLPHEVIGEIWIPTPEEIGLAYDELGSITFTQEKKDFINKVYQFLFNEEFDFSCRSCGNVQARRFKNYLGR
jgi:hypothetical protein